jgi:DNA-directed RNA polymerase subunit RPC12/RpoP
MRNLDDIKNEYYTPKTNPQSAQCPSCGLYEVVLEKVTFPDSFVGHQYKCLECKTVFL